MRRVTLSLRTRIGYSAGYTMPKGTEMKRVTALLFLLVVTALPARAGEITVFAAASLTDALETMRADFQAGHPGDTPRFIFAASGELLRRIDNGEACDVFISADMETMDAAAGKGRIDPATRADIAENALVLAVPAGNPARVTGLASLSLGGVRRIGVGNPESVPAGRYAKRALQHQAQWFALASKLTYYPSVRHVLAALAKGECDAGFIYATDARIPGQPVEIAATIPLIPPVVYAAAVTTEARDKNAASGFLAYLVSPEGRAILARFGFTAPR